MKYKFFAADSEANIEKAVNGWMAKQSPQPTVRLSDTKMTTVKAGAKSVTAVTVGIWYD